MFVFANCIVCTVSSDRVFNGLESLPTRLRIDEAFGATHPEDYSEEEQQYVLTFPGLAFYFPSETKVGISPLSSLTIILESACIGNFLYN